MSKENTSNKTALITGASSGIGEAFATRLAQDGYDLIVVARRRDRLEALAGKLQGAHGVRVETLVADLSEPAEMRAVEERIAAGPALDLLVNNAGIGGYKPFAELDPDTAEQLVNLNILAVTRLTRAALPGMLERKRGAIINVSSRLAFSAPLGSGQLPKRAVYAGSKAYVNAFSTLVHSELEGTGVQVQALCPGLVATEFHGHVGADLSHLPAGMIMSPEDLVAASLKGLDLGEVICVPALEDPALLAGIDDSQRKFFEGSRTGKPASRYTTRHSSDADERGPLHRPQGQV